EGFPPADVGTTPDELGALAGCETRPVMRIEQVAEKVGIDGVGHAVAGARSQGYVALKTIAAYRGGLDLDALRGDGRPGRLEGAALRDVLLAALEANEATGDPLPVQ